jgi:two-component system response regulator TctD
MRALVVEDQRELREQLCAALAGWGYEVCAADDGASALTAWRESRPDVVLLDLGLPDMDGLEVLGRARAGRLDTPVLVLTARATVGDRVLGLNCGADACLVKPCDLQEVRARVLALTRRQVRAPALVPPTGHVGPLRWDEQRDCFTCAGQPLALSPREQALLRALYEQPHRAVAREQLLRRVFPRDDVRDEALEVVACRLRKKLAAGGITLVTLRGLGYLIRTD